MMKYVFYKIILPVFINQLDDDLDKINSSLSEVRLNSEYFNTSQIFSEYLTFINKDRVSFINSLYMKYNDKDFLLLL